MGTGKGQTKRVKSVTNRSSENAAIENLNHIFGMIEKADFYLVGGSVRDELLGHNSKDLDFVAIGISQEDLLSELRNFGQAQVTGDSFDVTRFRPEGENEFEVEIAMPRIEASTGDGHNDFDILESGETVSLEDDLSRRDFTINAIAKHVNTGELVAPENALNDIKTKTLRLVNPTAFKEDPLRILRGVQFISRFDLELDPDTLQSMKDEVAGLETITWERKLMEMDKLMKGNNRGKAIDLMKEIGAWDYVIPEINDSIGCDQNSFHAYDVYTHLREVADNVPSDDIDVRWAALLHDIGKPGSKWVDDKGVAHFYKNPKDPKAKAHETLGAEMSEEILNRMRMPKNRTKRIKLLVDNHMKPLSKPTPKLARQIISSVGKENVDALMDLHEGDKRGSGKVTEEKLAEIAELRNMIKHEIEIGSPTSIGDLAINGNDLIEAGFPQDKSISYALGRLLKQVLKDPSANNSKTLLSRANSFNPNNPSSSFNQKKNKTLKNNVKKNVNF